MVDCILYEDALCLPELERQTHVLLRNLDLPQSCHVGFLDYAKTNKKFSGYIAYENSFEFSGKDGQSVYLEITEAGEDVEVFVNGESLGIQVLPHFVYDLSSVVRNGENHIRIEVATTLERERGANKKNQAPTGIYGEVRFFEI